MFYREQDIKKGSMRVIKDSASYVIVENQAESRIAIRKPLSGNWKPVYEKGMLIALEYIGGA